MSFTITKHPLVEDDLEEIDDLIAAYSGRDVSIQKIADILIFIEKLRDFPNIGTVRSDILPGLRALPASRKAIVCFVVHQDIRVVSILAIAYGGTDWQARVIERRSDTV